MAGSSRQFSPFNKQLVQEADVRELVGSIIDIVVPELAPDFFRFVDQNSDGELSHSEWEGFKTRVVDALESNQDETQTLALTLMFTIIDKNGSKVLEPSEVLAFFDKIIKLFFFVLESGVRTCSSTICTLATKQVVEICMDKLDVNQDGKLSIEECTRNWKENLLRTVMKVTRKQAWLEEKEESLKIILAKIGFLAVQELSGWGGDVREAFMQLVKQILCGKGEAVLAEVQKTKTYQTTVQGENAKGWINNLEGCFEDLKAGKFDTPLREFSNALFDLLDSDGDGRLGSNEVTVWTNFLTSQCDDLEDMKGRIRALFSVVANGQDHISREALESMVMKLTLVVKTLVVLLLEMTAQWVSSNVSSVITAALDFYKLYRQRIDDVEVGGFTVEEFMRLVVSGPEWAPRFAKQQTKAEPIL